MKLLITTFILGSSLFLSGCFDHEFCELANGYVETREYYLTDFDGINLGIAANVIITKGNEQRVVIEGQEELLNELNTHVKSGIWNITLNDCYRRYKEMNIYITTPGLDYIVLSGSGTITSQDLLSENELTVNMPGAGTIDLNVDVNKLITNMSGAGNITLSGIANESKCTISGSGNILANGLITNSTDINISGSGNAYVHAENQLYISITGSGNVFYQGNPEITISKSSSGNVIDNN